MQIGKYVINPRYIRYFYIDQDETDTNCYKLIIELTGGDTSAYKDQLSFTFDNHEDVLKVHKYLKRKMNG